MPVDAPFAVRVDNLGRAPAIDGVLTITLPDGVTASAMDDGATVTGSLVTWDLPSIGASGASTPPNSRMRALTLRFTMAGTYVLSADVSYRVGVSTRHVRRRR